MKNIWLKITGAISLLAGILAAIFFFRSAPKNSDTDEIVEEMFQSEKAQIEEEKKAVEEKTYTPEEIEKKYNGN